MKQKHKHKGVQTGSKKTALRNIKKQVNCILMTLNKKTKSVSCWFCNDIFNHTSLCQFYQGRLLLHVMIPFEEKPASNLPGDNLRYYRQRKSLTTGQLAEQIDVVPATILMYEQNKHPIPFDVANGLADALDVKADLLYDDFAVFLAAPYSQRPRCQWLPFSALCRFPDSV